MNATNEEVLAAIQRLDAKFEAHAEEDAKNFAALHGADEELRDDVEDLQEQVRAATHASRRAANAAMKVSANFDEFRTEVRDNLAEHTGEILRLVRTDAIHDERLAKFEAACAKTTAAAVQQIAAEADKAGSGLSKRVTIPVGVIAAIATLIQWLIQNWPRR